MKLKKLIAVSAAAAVSVLGLAVAPAFAAEPAPGDIPAGKTGTLTVHKYANPGIANGAKADGTETSKFESATPIKGVKFKVTKLKMDLTTVAGWKSLPANAAAVTDAQKDTFNSEMTTGDDGSAKFTNLAVGAYLVEETDITGAVPAVKADGKAASFIVTVPYNNRDAGWLYDVHVYPKNNIESGTASKTIKEVAGATYMKGDDIPWSFDLPVNPLAAGKTRTAFGTWDAVADYLTFKNVTGAKFISAAGAEENITVSCEATNDTWAAAGYDHKLYKCLVAAADLSKLKAGGKVVFTVNTTLGDIPAGKSAVEQAFTPIDSTEPGGDVPPPGPGVTPVNPEKTPYVGDLQFSKIDAKTANLALGGAKFELHKLGGDGTCATPGDKLTGAEATSEKSTGKVVFNNVFVKLDTPGQDATAQGAMKADYCLVETEAPAGYVKANATKVTITAGTTATAGGLANNAFTNTKDDSIIPSLPLTGAAGRVLLGLLGAAVIALGIGFGIRSARKQ